jgi:thioesterase domain-containing protein
MPGVRKPLTVNEQELEQLLHHEIPITQAMGIGVVAVDNNGLSLSAPLALNDNHKATAFGGSLNTLAITAGWSFIQTRLHGQQIEAQVVIQESQCRYLKPVNQDLLCRCLPPNEKDWGRFLKTLAKHGRARIAVECISEYAGEVALRYQGTYVAQIIKR